MRRSSALAITAALALAGTLTACGSTHRAAQAQPVTCDSDAALVTLTQWQAGDRPAATFTLTGASNSPTLLDNNNTLATVQGVNGQQAYATQLTTPTTWLSLNQRTTATFTFPKLRFAPRTLQLAFTDDTGSWCGTPGGWTLQ